MGQNVTSCKLIMQSISGVIDAKKHQEIISIIQKREIEKQATRELPERDSWKLCKDAVRGLTTAVEEVAARYKDMPKRMKVFSADVRKTYDILLDKIHGYEVSLIIYYSEEQIKKARYIAWNDEDNVAFYRDINELEVRPMGA